MISLENFYDVVKNSSIVPEKNKEWKDEVYNSSYDPTDDYGSEVKIFREEFPLHKNISWDWIIPVVDAGIDDGSTRILDPRIETSSVYNIEETLKNIQGLDSNVSRDFLEEFCSEITKNDSWLYTTVSHSTVHYSDSLKLRYIEAREKHNLRQCHIYTSYSKKTSFFGRHNDSMSSIIVAGIGDVEYSFDDGKSYVLHPGDGIYIPRGTYHKPNIFGPRATFSYCWSYKR